METMVLKMVFMNEDGEKATISIKDVLENAPDADISDLMNKIIQAGFLIKHSKATSIDSAQFVKTIITDVEFEQ
jgi:thiamine phosphate synthase YjbQ (UPF0047 family)